MDSKVVVSHAFDRNTGLDGARLRVELEHLDDGSTRLSVCDNGKGLPKEFDPQANANFGLQIIHALARQLHGELTFTTTEPGRGTCATLLIPPEST